MDRLLLRLLTASVCVLSLAGPVELIWAKPPVPAKDDFAPTRQQVLAYFRQKPDYRPGDFVTREDALPLLNKLQKSGLPAADAGKIASQMVGRSEFLAAQLATPQGKAFMRRIARYPNAFDRLDRLSQLPRGEQTIRDLIRGPGGERLVQYMTETNGGKNLGKQLSEIPNSPDFNSPTGRIYTAERLLDQLQAAYARARTTQSKASQR